jgi:hypothetical protein
MPVLAKSRHKTDVCSEFQPGWLGIQSVISALANAFEREPSGVYANNGYAKEA